MLLDQMKRHLSEIHLQELLQNYLNVQLKQKKDLLYRLIQKNIFDGKNILSTLEFTN